MAGRAEAYVVIGIGNPERGDDAAGREVARRLNGALAERVRVIEADGEVATLVAYIEGAGAAFLIDASFSGAVPGTVRRFDVGSTPLLAGTFRISTHGVGVAEAVELARALGVLPPVCVVYAIEGAAFDLCAPLSPAVAVAIDDVAARLAVEISAL